MTSVNIKYWLNQSASPQEFKWVGNLDFMESEIVTIPSPRELWMDIKEDNNKFYAELSNPNSGTDEYIYNNLFTSNIDIPEVFPSKIKVNIRTNNIPSENSYQLFDDGGNVVGGNNLSSANTTTTDEYDLEDGCFKLIFTDSGGDGLAWWANTAQGSGSAYISDEDGAVLNVFEADCGSGFEYSFATTFPVSQQEIDYLTSIKVYPNPSQNYVVLSSNDLSNSSFHITDQSGKRLNSRLQSQNNTSVTFDISDLNSGIYFITISNGTLKTTRKVIKH